MLFRNLDESKWVVKKKISYHGNTSADVFEICLIDNLPSEINNRIEKNITNPMQVVVFVLP